MSWTTNYLRRIGIGTAILVAAATAAGASGDGSGALAIADLQRATNLTGNSQTYEDYFNGMLTRLGVSVRDASGIAAAQGATISHLEQLRASVSGVNLDEEMVSMVQFQKGYEAAAKVISTINQMLDELMSMVG